MKFFYTLFGSFTIFGFLLGFAFTAFQIWLVLSLLTSGIKAATNSCHQPYAIEKLYVQGEWFCPDNPNIVEDYIK